MFFVQIFFTTFCERQVNIKRQETNQPLILRENYKTTKEELCLPLPLLNSFIGPIRITNLAKLKKKMESVEGNCRKTFLPNHVVKCSIELDLRLKAKSIEYFC